MKNLLLTIVTCLYLSTTSFSQSASCSGLPMKHISEGVEMLRKSSAQQFPALPAYTKPVAPSPSSPMSAMQRRITPPVIRTSSQRRSSALSPAQIDTAFVGAVPNDTLIVTGNWTCNGPVYVFNDGVLIFDHANATILGDIYVWGNGTLIADSTQFNIPQAWFYQRSVLVLDSSDMILNNCSFDFSGLSHNFIFQGDAQATMNHIHQNDWTTAGLWGNPTVSIDDCDLVGEYIITGTSQFTVSHSESLLVWHHYPDTAIINTTFPSGNPLGSYTCNNSQQGIDGIGYSIQLDSCSSVWWALMPVNGSDITLNNSTIRAVGAWFERGDSVNASGLVNNSVYSNFTAPLPDRNLHFNNCNVQTWSLYVFDTSYLHITGCILGEVGTQFKSMCFAENFLMDGSGGYFWATDTSFIVSSLSSAMSIVRSERNGIFVFGYGACNTNPPTALGNSVMIVVQSSVPQDPVAEESAVAWYANINGPAVGSTNTTVAVNGTAFIDQGPQASWMDFQAYSLYYQAPGDTVWHPIVIDSTVEIRHNSLASWNTIGLTPGNYTLKLTLINNLGDSVDAQKNILLQPGTVGIYEMSQTDLSIYPVPADQELFIEKEDGSANECVYQLLDLNGKLLLSGVVKGSDQWRIRTGTLSDGIYLLSLQHGEEKIFRRFSVLHH